MPHLPLRAGSSSLQVLSATASVQAGRGVLAWLIALLLAASSPHPGRARSLSSVHHSRPTPTAITQHVFGNRWRSAWCVSYYESRRYLGARNGANLGPWQINVTAHPWADPWRLTHSWRYSARVAYRISAGGTDWSAWSTASLCGL